MKKITIIVVAVFIANNIKSQQFGLTADVGMSRLSELYGRLSGTENKSQLYYGVGLFFAKQSASSKWGFKVGLDFNKRGARALYEGSQFINSNNIYIVSSSTLSTNSISLNFSPTLNVSDKVQFFLAPHINYTIGNTDDFETIYYETEAKQKVVDSFNDKDSYNSSNFSDRLSYGARVGFNVMLSNNIDLGLTYQYARQLNSNGGLGPKPFYNIINLSTNIYFKGRE